MRLVPQALSELVALVALVALPLPACGHFVASLHSNFVVNLDFEGQDAQAVGGDADDSSSVNGLSENKVMAFAGGKRKFTCRLPTGKNRTAGEGRPPDISKFTSYFRNAKLVPLKGRCWKLRKDYWTYEACFGRKIAQFNAGGDARFSLGEHVPEADQLLPSGEVVEWYTGGTDNRSSEVHYVCGSSEASQRVFLIEEKEPLKYIITVGGPAFCSWREKEGNMARDREGNPYKVSSLLEDLRSACVNVTQGWWTYEYCYPNSLRQYHLNQGGQGVKNRDPEHVLGTLNGTSENVAPNQVNMTLIRLKPSISSPRERRAPPSNHRTLRQFLGSGTVCDETGRPRTTIVHFQCPPNWQSRPETRIVSINEASLCDYEMLVHTTLLCGHQKFIPSLPRGKEPIQCVAQPMSAEA